MEEYSGEALEITAAKAAAYYIHKQHKDENIEYNLILIGSGDMGPERRMMDILQKKKRYTLKNVWLVDVYCPSQEIIKDIKDHYTHYVHCVNFPEMKKILIQSKPSLFDNTYLLGIHFAITYMGLKDTALSKEFFKIHKDPWFWQHDLGLPSNIQRTLREPTNQPDIQHRIQEMTIQYYRQWMTQLGLREDLQMLVLDPNASDSPEQIQMRSARLIYPLIGNEIGEFFYYWIVWFQKSVGFAWRDGRICSMSIKDFNLDRPISYIELLSQIMDKAQAHDCKRIGK